MLFLAGQAPIPRFVSLRANEVNLHVGPGLNYSVDWKFIRKGLPVEVLAEFDTWRQIRDFQGTTGWVHKSLLSSVRMICVLESVCRLHQDPNDQSKIIANVEPGVLGKALECQGQWCKVEIKSEHGALKGWISKQHIWGVYSNEIKF